MTRALCHHCGLPITTSPVLSARRLSGEAGPAFCCYGCALAWRIVGEQDGGGVPASLLARFGLAGILAMNVMMVSILLYSDALAGLGPQAIHGFRWVLLLLSVPVLLLLGGPPLLGAVRELGRRLPGTDSLVALGAFAGFGVSAVNVIRGQGHIYFDTATMLLVLTTLGRLLEASAKAHASRNLRALLSLAPARACLLKGDQRRTCQWNPCAPGIACGYAPERACRPMAKCRPVIPMSRKPRSPASLSPARWVRAIAFSEAA